MIFRAVKILLVLALLKSVTTCQLIADVPLVELDPNTNRPFAQAIVVIPDNTLPIANYAAEEFIWHVEQSTGVKLILRKESENQERDKASIYVGVTKAAERAGIDVQKLPPEACLLRTVGGHLFIVGNDGPGDPLSIGHTHSGTLWGVYELLEQELNVRWLWPGRLGTDIPKQKSLALKDQNRTILPNYIQRQLRPSLGPRGFATADERLAFSKEQREQYAHDQKVFLRRHRMGRSPNTYFSERRFGSGHAFHGWWEQFGEEHPEWFQQLANGKRGPADLNRPHKVSMCVSNPELHRKVVELWAEEREKRPGQPLGLGVGESDGSAACQCAKCLEWDGEPIDLKELPPGLERSFLPVQAGTRYAKLAREVHTLASKIDPHVKVHYYAYLNYFWAPTETVKLHPNIMIGFVPWFRWAGWFPRTEAEQEWIKQQWAGWKRTGATLYYRPNWFLDGYSMPHVYMHQFGDAFQFYHQNGMIGTDFDSLQGMWAAQGPNLYLLSRIHVRPDAPIEQLLDEYYAAFGPAEQAVRKYFDYWEEYSTKNRARATNSIQSRANGKFRRYAFYARVADELYSSEVFDPAFALLDQAQAACESSPDPSSVARVAFLRTGLEHSLECVKTAAVINNPQTSPADLGQALARLAAYRSSIEHLGIANMDRAAIIETDSWQKLDGFSQPWPEP